MIQRPTPKQAAALRAIVALVNGHEEGERSGALRPGAHVEAAREQLIGDVREVARSALIMGGEVRIEEEVKPDAGA